MPEYESDVELLAVRARFRALAAEWDLGRNRVALLLDVEEDRLGLDLIPRSMDGATERRMRLLLRVRDLLPAITSDARDVPVVLRWVDPGDPRACSLLDLMMGSTTDLKQVVGALSVHAERISRDGLREVAL